MQFVRPGNVQMSGSGTCMSVPTRANAMRPRGSQCERKEGKKYLTRPRLSLLRKVPSTFKALMRIIITAIKPSSYLSPVLQPRVWKGRKAKLLPNFNTTLPYSTKLFQIPDTRPASAASSPSFRSQHHHS